jgi:hypothetical protein
MGFKNINKKLALKEGVINETTKRAANAVVAVA